ncbi:ABC transporter ATP-binding protein [Kordiimonas gwangyangensis]|uniref:ABC transporter ATP-binding protein n=1 Tax=Kordiimonas gwangyangensis TaxID=288022 RepID=UPI000470BA88|nr:ABC transporter ATP-binding protein [Kordiimonas gwangyangensis]
MTAAIMRDVRKVYPHFTLDGINLDLPAGQIMGLIGPNGAGKSTTIRILMGLVHQDAGEVQVFGHAMPAGEVKTKADIGYVSEDMRLYGGQTLKWHMGFIASIFPSWDQSYADDLLRRFDLTADQKIKGMSHGQRVKASLLLVLARMPRLLILDEPTTGLDPVARQEVLAALMDVLADEERTILFSSHNTQDVEQLSDSITFIDRGKVIASDDKESFLDSWRRIRFEVPNGANLPTVPGQETVQTSGHISVVTTSNFSDASAKAYEASGARIMAVEHMTLEEIFLSNVSASRGRALQ